MVGFKGGSYGFISFPFTHVRMMFRFLSYSVMFQNVPSLNTPTYSCAKREMSIPLPFSFPSLYSPTYLFPLDQVYVP